MFVRLLTLATLLCVGAAASAAPVSFNHQGRLFDSVGGAPLDGSLSVTFSLYDDATAGSNLWTQTGDIDFDNGYFNAELADVDDALIDGSALYLGMTVDGGTELPTRLAIRWVPLAAHARSVSGGSVDASQIAVGGTTIVDSSGAFVASIDWSQVQNAPAGELSGLGCSAAGDLAMADGSGGWSCVNENALTIAAPQIGGTLVAGQLPVGIGSTDVAAGNHTHTAADVGAVAAGGSGGLVVTDSSVACTSAPEHGTLRFDSLGQLQVCGALGWITVASTGSDGSSQNRASESCKQLIADYPSSGDGTYWIDPNGGATTDAFEVYCDMTYDSGGWTLVMKLSAGDFCWNSALWDDGLPYAAAGTLDPAPPTNADHKNLAFHELTDVSELHLVTQDGDLLADFVTGATPENLMTTNDVDFATYPVWNDWKTVFGPGRERAPIFMRAGVPVTDPAGCRTNPAATPTGCGKLCVFCYQASDGTGCGNSTQNDVVFGMGGDPAYCGSGSAAYCSTGGTWSDPNNKTVIWAR